MSVSVQAVNVLSFAGMGGLKSTQDRQERQQKCDSQVNFFEQQKEKLKDMVTVAFIISGFRAKNPDWARKAITEYYARLKAKQR